jgi:hypothetical protein
MQCIYCGKEITKWDLFKGWFWKLQLRLNEFSYVWEGCCSYKCYGLQLERMLKALGTESREEMDLADFLLHSLGDFVSWEAVCDNLDKIDTSGWAKHIIAAGYRKVVPNNNPYRFWHERDGMG